MGGAGDRPACGLFLQIIKTNETGGHIMVYNESAVEGSRREGKEGGSGSAFQVVKRNDLRRHL